MLGRQLWRLGKHSAIYGLGAVVARLIGLFLLPVVTRYLTRAELGRVDTLIALSVVLVIVFRAGISMAFFRFYFDADDDARAHPGRPHLLLVHDGRWRRSRSSLGAALAPQISDWLFSTPLAGEPRARRASCSSGRR